MSSEAINLAARLSTLAAAVKESPDELVQLLGAVIPPVPAEKLPPISDALDLQLWAYLDGELNAEQEALFFSRCQSEPQVLLHLQQIIRDQSLESETAAAVSEMDESKKTVSPKLKPDYVIVLGRNGLRSGGREARFGSRSLAMARSGAGEATTSLTEERLTAIGTLRLTIDLRKDQTCQVSLELTSSVRDSAGLVFEWRNCRDETVERIVAEQQAVRFAGVPAGQVQIVILDPQEHHRELDRIVIEIQTDADESV